jgi:ATP-dependent DNA helicase Rep
VLNSYEEDDNKEENVDNDPRENVLKMVEFAGRKGSVTEFYDWIQKVQRGLRARTDCLTLSTIHQSKGKEWPYVFVVGVNQDVLPHCKGELEEERRIFFVACSRAAKALHVSASGVASELIRHKLPENGVGVTIDPWEGYELLRD